MPGLIAIAPAAGTVVTLDGTVTHGQQRTLGNAATCTVAHVTGTLTNGLMLIAITVGDEASGTAPAISSVTWNASAVGISLVTSIASGSATDGKLFLYQLVAPASGNHNVVVNATGNGGGASAVAVTVGVATFDGVNQTTPITGSGTTNGGASGTNTTVTVASATNDMVFAVHGEGSSAGFTSTNQTQQYIENINGNSSCGNGACNTAAGAASVVMTAAWVVSDSWGVIGVDINHV